MRIRTHVVSLFSTYVLVGGIWIGLIDQAEATLQAYWNFDEGAGTTAADSANSNDGTLLGATLPGWVSGHTGAPGDSALDFFGEAGVPGTKTHVLVPDGPDLNTIGDQTISMWLRPLARAGLDAGGPGVHYGAPGSGSVGYARQNPWHKHYNNEGTWTVEPTGTINYYYGDGAFSSFSSGTGLPTASSWDMFTMVRDLDGSGTGTVKWYKNGLLTSTGTATRDPAVASAFNLQIGTGYTNTFDGQIDDAATWDETLSVPEITSMYQLSTGPTNALRDLGYQIDELDMLWQIYDGGPGSSGVVGGKRWSYIDGISAGGRVLGEAWSVAATGGQTGFETFLLLDTGTNAGVVLSEVVPEPSSFLLPGLGALGLVRHTRDDAERHNWFLTFARLV